jgi:hypothetical protein
VGVRVIAATNRDLLTEAREKRFREDLYYRLNVFPVWLPPLRERKDDTPLLVRFLVGKFAHRVAKRLEGVSRATMQRLQAYPWPGNIRELENVVAVKLEGDPLGPWVASVRDACEPTGLRSRRPRLDLAAVRYADAAGAQLLRDLVGEGIEIAACSGFVGELLPPEGG